VVEVSDFVRCELVDTSLGRQLSCRKLRPLRRIDTPSYSGPDFRRNALAESFNGLFKAELIRRYGPWRASATSGWPPSSTSTGSTAAASTPPAPTYPS
jgi:hypothetical protein